jgi:hypothetical protein
LRHDVRVHSNVDKADRGITHMSEASRYKQHSYKQLAVIFPAPQASACSTNKQWMIDVQQLIIRCVVGGPSLITHTYIGMHNMLSCVRGQLTRLPLGVAGCSARCYVLERKCNAGALCGEQALAVQWCDLHNSQHPRSAHSYLLTRLVVS